MSAIMPMPTVSDDCGCRNGVVDRASYSVCDCDSVVPATPIFIQPSTAHRSKAMRPRVPTCAANRFEVAFTL